MNNYYCECCFEPVTPVSINTTHECPPGVKTRREEERDDYHRTMNEDNEVFVKEAYESAEKSGDDVWWVDKDIMLGGVPRDE